MKTKEQINKDLAYLWDKINWGASFLDAEAIGIMNTIRNDINNLENPKGVEKMSNEEEIFCLISRFENRLNECDWAILDKDKVRLNKEGEELSILDEVKSRIAKELSEHYKVEEI
jgi:hypothetical protein